MTMLLSSFLSTLPHEHLPPPLNDLAARYVLLVSVESADYYLIVGLVLLTCLAFIQLKAFARPPPVPLKKLPRRPILSVLFKPDDIASENVDLLLAGNRRGGGGVRAGVVDSGRTAADASAEEIPATVETANTTSPSAAAAAAAAINSSRRSSMLSTSARAAHLVEDVLDDDDEEEDDFLFDDDEGTHDSSGGGGVADEPKTPKSFAVPAMDMPDSFAPLLSSSHVEVLTDKLTADLVHAVQCEGGVRMRPGRHEVPLDKDSSRPQLVLDVPKTGCRLSAVALIGSDGFSAEEDLDVSKSTTSRSTPMVKNAGVVFDPPLPLSNVAPTLIHFPTLFEDVVLHKTLRRIQIVRMFLDFVVSISSLIEQLLWIVESKCQIHLAKIRVVPIYKGQHRTLDGANAGDGSSRSPEWRLSLSFSGHLLLFGWIPIPFIHVTLPTFIIPQPHALLEYLLTNQPLASARIRRENIAERRIALAVIGTAESWTSKVSAVTTPPAVAVDLFLAGGVSCAVECELGRDPHAGRSRGGSGGPHGQKLDSPTSQHRRQTGSVSKQGGVGATIGTPAGDGDNNSMSSWTTNPENPSESVAFRQGVGGVGAGAPPPLFNANDLVPWKIELSAKGTVSHEKMSVHILKFSLEHEGVENGVMVSSRFATRGSFAIWKYQLGGDATNSSTVLEEPSPMRRVPSTTFSHHRKVDSFGRSCVATLGTDTPSVAAVLLFPEDVESFHRDMRMLKYDYAFDVFEDSKVDALTVTVAATHPMLKGGTLITTIIDSIYAYGSVAARDDAVLDPEERKRKRNILRHLPAVDFTLGVNNVYIPPESYSYSDDGQTLFVPEATGGRAMVRVLGGISGVDERSLGSNVAPSDVVAEGVKLVADFTVPSLLLRTEGKMKEFPELDVLEGVKLRTYLSGVTNGSIRAHLRPQKNNSTLKSTGRNIFNPLEAYEVDFSKSMLSVKVKECNMSLGHRRVVFPSESTVIIKIEESIVDMAFEGKTKCDLSWDFQGLSPILQVTRPGKSPAEATPEDKEQASLLVAPLRQGRFSLNVSSVGGISITKAATSREDKEGLYDWKFINALVSPDSDSPGRIIDVLHDKRTMEKLLQVAKLVNKDLFKILRYTIQQVWHAKEIFDSEGITEPGDFLPMDKMARLISLLITGELDQVEKVYPIIEKVVNGDGLDVVRVKELMREHMEKYDDWAPELDRAVRWAAVALGPMTNLQPNVEEVVVPLAELPQYKNQFRGIPSASELYERLLDRPQLPLDAEFSNLVSRVAPYLSFRQIEFFLEARASSDWQPSDLRRIRYVYSIKRKVLEIAESYGGLSFLPQSFLVSVFLGEATRTVMRAPARKNKKVKRGSKQPSVSSFVSGQGSRSAMMPHLRRRRATNLESRLTQVAEVVHEEEEDEFGFTPAERITSLRQFDLNHHPDTPSELTLDLTSNYTGMTGETYELGDSLLGPQDVAILLQAGLTSVMKSSTVVQLNQRMLLDLICSQPRSFAISVLAEIGSPSGHGSVRGLTMALMAFLELDQTAFRRSHQIDIHALLESWLPGLKIPRRADYLAGGRWARQSYYEALYSVATSILDDAESYAALKTHLQRVREHEESDPIPQPKEIPNPEVGMDLMVDDSESGTASRLKQSIGVAQVLIKEADDAGRKAVGVLFRDKKAGKDSDEYKNAIRLYTEAFAACAKVQSMDKHAFQAPWFREVYRRNYDSLMVKNMYDNVIENVDNVRHWLHRMLAGAKKADKGPFNSMQDQVMSSSSIKELSESDECCLPTVPIARRRELKEYNDELFLKPENFDEQTLVDAILDSTMYDEFERERLRQDPLLRLLIPNPPGHYRFTVITAMGVVTEGKRGREMADAFKRLEKQRGVQVIRSDTATARSLEYNASKIEEAIEAAVELGKPYGYVGYSQGCANAFMAETNLLSGSPRQRQLLTHPSGGLVCRQLLFSAANGSFHGAAMDKKTKRLITLCEEFFKYQQGYVSRALSSLVLGSLNSLLDSSSYHKVMGGAQSFLAEGCRAFWREAQHLSHVPTCTLRAVMEDHTTPECLEMISHLLTKQSGSALHDSQVHVFDAVGHPTYYHNRNGKILRACDVGSGAIQRSHHWSPLSDEVDFVRTEKDIEMASYDCAKDRHVFPWIDVNARFGIIKYASPEEEEAYYSHGKVSEKDEWHPVKLFDQATKQK